MPKFTVTMWYTAPVWTTLEIEAVSANAARRKAEEIFLTEDTSQWNESDGDLDIDVDYSSEAADEKA